MSSGSSTVVIRGACRDLFLFLVHLWPIEGVEINGRLDADDGVGEAEGDRYGDDTGNGVIVGEYITAPLDLIIDMAIMGERGATPRVGEYAG